MYTMLERVRKLTGVTVLHVTHSQNEAVRLADRLFRIEDGIVGERSLPTGKGGASGGHLDALEAREEMPHEYRRPR